MLYICRIDNSTTLVYLKVMSKLTIEEKKAKAAAKSRAYYAAHPDKVKAAQAKWRAANLTSQQAKDRLYKASNPSKVKTYYTTNTAKLKTYQAAYVVANPEKVKAGYLQRKYGITLEQYNILLVKQNSNCAICGINQANLSRALAVDHCHTTGKIRGLLCSNCNTGLGLFDDNVGNLTAAIQYLATPA